MNGIIKISFLVLVSYSAGVGWIRHADFHRADERPAQRARPENCMNRTEARNHVGISAH